jgi:hypothetical protein
VTEREAQQVSKLQAQLESSRREIVRYREFHRSCEEVLADVRDQAEASKTLSREPSCARESSFHFGRAVGMLIVDSRISDLLAAYAPTTLTSAQELAARFGNDGTCWEDGETFTPLEDCLKGAAVLTTRPQPNPYRGGAGPIERWVFPDGSAILTTDHWWDVEAEGRPWVCAGAPEEGELGVPEPSPTPASLP